MKASVQKRVRLLIDLDGVTVDLLTPWFELYNEAYDDDLKVEDVTKYAVEFFAKDTKGIYEVLKTPGLFRNLKPLPGAIETLKQLYEDGFDIHIVTAAPTTSPIALTEKFEWVEENLPFLPLRNVKLVHDKWHVVGDIIFDDSPTQLYQFSYFQGISVAMAAPYNPERGDFRVETWEEFYDLLKNMADCANKDTEGRTFHDWIHNGPLEPLISSRIVQVLSNR